MVAPSRLWDSHRLHSIGSCEAGFSLIFARVFRIIASSGNREMAIMGGINSGRRRSTNRGAVEKHPAIDLRVLRRAGLLSAGECTYTTLHCQNQGLEALSVRIFIDLSDADATSIRIAGNGSDTTPKQRVAIGCVPCPLGGVRYYFLCPLEGRRCEQLFLVDGIFASRKAHRLTYASQSEDELSRAKRKLRKLYRQIGGDARYARPRGGNRWRTMQRGRAAQDESRMLYRERLRALVVDES